MNTIAVGFPKKFDKLHTKETDWEQTCKHRVAMIEEAIEEVNLDLKDTLDVMHKFKTGTGDGNYIYHLATVDLLQVLHLEKECWHRGISPLWITHFGSAEDTFEEDEVFSLARLLSVKRNAKHYAGEKVDYSVDVFKKAKAILALKNKETVNE